MHGTLTDTGAYQPLTRKVLPPYMERALRIGCVRLQTERDQKRELVEWHWRESCRLVDEMQYDGIQLREWRQILNVRGVFNDE